jgi:hypothetical protein
MHLAGCARDERGNSALHAQSTVLFFYLRKITVFREIAVSEYKAS